MQLKKCFVCCCFFCFFKLHSKAKMKFVMCLQALKGKKNPITSFCCMQGKGKKIYIHIYIYKQLTEECLHTWA